MEARDLSDDRVPPFELAMRIRHPSLDPAEITRELQLEPEHSFKAGDPRTSSSGIAAASVHAESYWLSHIDLARLPSPGLFDERPGAKQLRPRISDERFRALAADSLGVALSGCVVAFFGPHREFLRRVKNEGGEVSLLVEVSAKSVPGFKLTPQVSRGLSDLGITVEFELVND
jgi:hypothetical protein